MVFKSDLYGPYTRSQLHQKQEDDTFHDLVPSYHFDSIEDMPLNDRVEDDDDVVNDGLWLY